MYESIQHLTIEDVEKLLQVIKRSNSITAFYIAGVPDIEKFDVFYDTEEKRYSTVPDLRKTIHWEPDLQIGEDGEVSVTFYNGDRYRCWKDPYRTIYPRQHAGATSPDPHP